MNLAKRSVLLTAILLCCVLPAWGQGAYASRIVAYCPAPGQYINDDLTGTPAAAARLTGGIASPVSLGAFGGYIIFGFDHTILNDPGNPYGIDFSLFGNAFAGSAEPGIVRVMKDENRNGLPDDTWYELAGSQHYAGHVTGGYRITYFNPHNPADDIPWTDNLSGSGFILKNTFHNQPYYPSPAYFPGINPDSLTFSGSRLDIPVSTENGILKTATCLFGYADNHAVDPAPQAGPDNPYTPDVLEGTGGDAFDISWAVDGGGRYVDLDGIDFIMVQTAVRAGAGPLGEISTDVGGVTDVSPDASLQGETRLISLEAISPVLPVNATILPEAVYFDRGRPVSAGFRFTSSDTSIAVISGEELVTRGGGTFRLTATVTGQDVRAAEKIITVVQPSSIRVEKSFGFLFTGDRGTVSYSIVDQAGEPVEGLVPEVTVEDTSVAVVLGIHDGQADLLARSPGQTVLTIKLPGTALVAAVAIRVIDNTGPVNVSISVKLEDRNLIPRKTFKVNKQDIGSRMQDPGDGSTAEMPAFVSLADALAVAFLSNGYTGGEKAFLFRKDAYSGHSLYLWQVGDDWEYHYGWGGCLDSGPYRQCWAAVVNDTVYFSGFDQVPLENGDVISVCHVTDILDSWENLSLSTGSQAVDPGEAVSLRYSLNTFSIDPSGHLNTRHLQLPGSARLFSNDLPLGMIDELREGDGDSLAVRFDLNGRYDLRVEGFPGEVIRVDAGITSSLPSREMPGDIRVYPNPFLDFVTVSFDGGSVMLTDLSGRIIFRGHQEGEWPFDHRYPGLNPGAYILVIGTTRGNWNKILIRP